MGSSRKRSTPKGSRVDYDSSNEEPEEIQANSEELVKLRAAFEQYSANGGRVAGAEDQEEDDKARKRRKLRERKAKARALLDSSHAHQKLDTSVLQNLDSDQLQKSAITISNDANDDDDVANFVEDNDGGGFRINRNSHASVHLTDGNMEVHLLGETHSSDLIASFLPGGDFENANAAKSITLPDLLEKRDRTPYRVFCAQKKGGPSKAFADATQQVLNQPKTGGKLRQRSRK